MRPRRAPKRFRASFIHVRPTLRDLFPKGSRVKSIAGPNAGLVGIVHNYIADRVIVVLELDAEEMRKRIEPLVPDRATLIEREEGLLSQLEGPQRTAYVADYRNLILLRDRRRAQ